MSTFNAARKYGTSLHHGLSVAIVVAGDPSLVTALLTLALQASHVGLDLLWALRDFMSVEMNHNDCPGDVHIRS